MDRKERGKIHSVVINKRSTYKCCFKSCLRLSLITFPRGWNIRKKCRRYLVCAGGVCDIVHTPALSMTWLTVKTITVMMDTAYISTKSPETPQKFNPVSVLVLVTNTLPGKNILWMANMTSRTRRSLLALTDILNISAPLQKVLIGISCFSLRETKSPTQKST